MCNFMPINLLGALVIIASYFIGNISPAILMAKAKGLDIKKEGSGNAGTTNVLRVLGKKYAIATLIIDVLKGTVAVCLGHLLVNQYVAGLCVVAVVLGHIWPIVFGFKGGKGVATCFGALMGYYWLIGLIALGIVALGTIVTKRMSFGAVLGAGTFPVVAYFLSRDFLCISIFLALLVIFKHRSNIGRLISGEEPKIGEKHGKQ